MITDSSINSSHDQVELKHNEEGIEFRNDEDSFQNDDVTPEISITHNEFLSRAEEQVPTFKITEEPPSMASQILSEKKSEPTVLPYQRNTLSTGHRKTNAINN